MLKFAKYYLLVLALVFSSTFQKSFANKSIQNSPNNEEPVANFDLLDPNVDPCEDFYQYSCGKWMEQNPIPGDETRWFRFSAIDEKTFKILKSILENYQNNNYDPAQYDAEKLGDFYSACMNSPKTSYQAQLELNKIITKINTAKKSEILALTSELHSIGIDALFGYYTAQDSKNATQMIGTIYEAGKGLPEKDYYIKKDFLEIRTKYLLHIQKMFQAAHFSPLSAEELSKRAFRIERALARYSYSAVDAMDPQKTYNPIGRTGLSQISDLDWNSYFNGIQYPSINELNVSNPTYFNKLAKLLSRANLTDIKAYLMWRTLSSAAPYATTALNEENFNFFGKELNGQKEQAPLWKKCISATDNHMGEALGEAFIQVAFGEKAKILADNMVLQVKNSLKVTIDKLDWMDSFTKSGAYKKINTLNQKIGYPDQFKKYDELNVDPQNYLLNVSQSYQIEFNKMVSEAGKKVDRTKWWMTPPTNNAYYDPALNEIVFPAGILQTPLFSVHANLAANLGATGATIGHEMTHGFDDSGSQYDENGNLNNWWSESSANIYKEKSQCLINQYNSYTIADGSHLNGELTLGENIADLGGLKLALDAYKAAEPNHNQENLKEFFVAYAQSWCGHNTPEQEKVLAMSDPHSPPKFRVNGVVSNIPEFETTFKCKKGQQMAPENRCTVW